MIPGKLFPRLAVAALATACSGNPPPMIGGPAANPTSATEPVADSARIVTPARGYSATVQLTRRDSIVLTLPDGQHQVQKLGRTASFSLSVSPTGLVRIRLDSISFTPPIGAAADGAVGTVWNGRLGSEGIARLRANRDTDLIDGLTPAVQGLLPAIPMAGVAAGARWADTTRSEHRVEIFDAKDQRQAEWSIGSAREVEGLLVLPVRVVEHYQQLGEGEQAGREMRMSAEGTRTATYYMTLDGRVDQIVQVDSANRLITIPASQQAVPTMQIVRTNVRFDYR